MAKKKNASKNIFIRLFLFFIFFGSVIGILSYDFFSNLTMIFEIKNEKTILEDKLISLEQKENQLNSDIKKMEDPEYAGRYAREDGMLSKDGEIIFRIPD